MMINGSMIIAYYHKIAINDTDNSENCSIEKSVDHREKNTHRNGPKTHYLRLPLIVFRLKKIIAYRGVSVQSMQFCIFNKK